MYVTAVNLCNIVRRLYNKVSFQDVFALNTAISVQMLV